ncbi:MAG: hypothetical protein KDA87_06255 [Planctomycetales bacterium]|nr:hypothetical protein [Planctomycetales bacterium]
MLKSKTLQTKLASAHPVVLAVIAGAAAFFTYSCMYAFRKPFTATSYDGMPDFLGLDYKSALVISQVIGYAISKFLGIKIVSEAKNDRRAVSILILILIAELALLGFALTKPPIQPFFMFLNGLPIGMVWGLVFSYLEGRRFTEVMGLILCASFIFASASVKDVGKYLMNEGIVEMWMPAVTGLCFAIPLLLSVWLLDHVPPPDDWDKAERTERKPMNAVERMQVFRRFAFGLIMLVAVYTMLTAYRDFRDNFMEDILVDMRGESHDVRFSKIETPVSVVVLFSLMAMVLVKDSMKAFVLNHVVLAAGMASAGIATWLFQAGLISDVVWLGITGFGTYVAYIPVNCMLFDRMIAAFRQVSNVGFFIYVADSIGYLGSVAVLIYKDFFVADLSWVEFFISISWALSILGVIGVALSLAYFLRLYRSESKL